MNAQKAGGNVFNKPSSFNVDLASTDFGMGELLANQKPEGETNLFNFGLECKMIIVWRQDQGLKNLPLGLSA